jgi:hypothetical protein
MMHGGEKSDPAVVAAKPVNEAERSAAELVERRDAMGRAAREWHHRRGNKTDGVPHAAAEYRRPEQVARRSR